MREFAAAFYNSVTWKRTRDEYAKSKGYLCERCLKAGRITPSEIVHHKKHLTPENINDPSITLAWDNLEALCRPCHGEEHKRIKRRWKINSRGEIFSSDAPVS